MEMSREVLEQKYNSMTNDALCKELGVSKATMLSYIKKAGIKMKGKGASRKVTIL